ncbi:hypothetical protein [Nonomuraea insulae]|uniref:Major facilitator superfamily (MFS) profile domain-containing protein n=1 Tax=Nonomuraea insulae TaxID=1616787 RepID=A0ABW1CBW3_9ACTN
MLVLIAGTEVPTPLYIEYQARFGFSAEVLTLVFATYALALIPALLVFGRLSDRFGRRTSRLGRPQPAHAHRPPTGTSSSRPQDANSQP